MKLLDGGLTREPTGLCVRLLGPVRLGNGNDEASLAPKVRQVLAVLALRPGAAVTHDTLIAELWGHNPPRSATTTMQTYIYQLRQAVEVAANHRGGHDILKTESPGYVLCDEAIDIDVSRFRALAHRARALSYDSPEESLSLGRHALSVVRGEPLADVNPGPVLRGSAVRLAEEVVALRELTIDTQMRLCRYGEVVLELYELCGRHPLRETFYYQLMHALARSGRRSEALNVYGQLVGILRTELGIEPSVQFQRLHRQILEGADCATLERFRLA